MSVPAAHQSEPLTDPTVERDAVHVNEPQDRLLFEANPQPMWVFDQASKRMLAVNAAALARYGYTREAFLQLTVMDIRRTPQGHPMTAQQIDNDAVGSNGLRLTARWQHALKDGGLIDVDVTSSDLEWEGRPARLVVVNEVTEQLALERQTERARSESRAALELLNHVIDRVGDAIIALDTELRFTYLNAPALRLMERDHAEQLIGRYIWDEYELEHGRAFHNAYVNALQTQRFEVFEAFYAPWDKWIEVRVFPSPMGLSIFCNDITERKLFERLLLAREREFRQMADQMPAMMYRASVDPPYHTLYISPYIRVLGFSASEWMADPQAWVKTLHPDDRERAMGALAELQEEGIDHQVEYRMRDAQGQWRHFRDCFRRIQPSDGSAAYVQGIALDITDLVESEQALRASEASLRRSEQRFRLAAAGGQVWDWDLVTDQLNLSPDFWQQLGFQAVPADQYRSHLNSMTHPQDIQRHRKAMRSHLKEHQPFNMEVRVGDARGEWRWLHIQGQAEWNAQGRAVFMAGTTVDITPRKKAEAALRESEAYRRSLFEQLADGVLLIDFNNRILDANSQALSMLGHEGQSLVDVSLQSVLVDQRPRIPHETLLENPKGLGPLVEWTIVRRDGTRLPVEVRTRALDATRYIAVLRDVADRHAAQTALVRYQLELSELTQRLLTQEKNTTQRVAQALHDNLGQSLAVARLNLDAVVATAGDTLPPVLAEQCHQLARMLAQAVLDVRQVLADLRPPLLEEQGLAAALDNEIRTTLMAIGTDVLLEVADGLTRQRWPLDVEYSAFMVVREAIANARLHARSSLIRVLLEGDANTLQLDVVDDGVGIPQDMQLGRPGHLGVVGMRERSISIGARFSVTGETAGGTRVTLHWEAPRS
jgi:PAS domain S-box-containing protein